jgi:hypothetical protein
MAKISLIKECAEKGIEVPGTQLIPIKYVQRNGHVDYWLFQCKCGNKKQIKYFAVGNSTFSCGCYSKSTERHLKAGRIRRILDPIQNSKTYWFNRYKRGALKRNLEFDLTFEESTSIGLVPCYYTGILNLYTLPFKSSKRSVKLKFDENYWKQTIININGLDRVDSTRGYTKDNVVSCCTQANLAKSKYTQEEFIYMCNQIAANHPRKIRFTTNGLVYEVPDMRHTEGDRVCKGINYRDSEDPGFKYVVFIKEEKRQVARIKEDTNEIIEIVNLTEYKDLYNFIFKESSND